MPRRPHGRTAHHCRCALPPGRCHTRPDPPALGARQRPLSFPRPAGFLARSRVARPSGAQAARPRRRTCSRTPHSLQACAQAGCTAAKVCAHFRAGSGSAGSLLSACGGLACRAAYLRESGKLAPSDLVCARAPGLGVCRTEPVLAQVLALVLATCLASFSGASNPGQP